MLAGLHRDRPPGDGRVDGAGAVAVTAPTGVLVLFFLLTLAFVGGARFVARIVYERPLRGFRAAARTRAAC